MLKPLATAAAAILIGALITGAVARDRPDFLVPLMPPEACMTAPDRACLLAALDHAFMTYERGMYRNDVATRTLNAVARGGVIEPALDVLRRKYDPTLTPEKLKFQAELTAKDLEVAKRTAASDAIQSADIGEIRAAILAEKSESSRISKAVAAVDRLTRTGRTAEADALFQAVVKTVRPGGPALASIAFNVSQSYAAAGAWALWSKALILGGYDRRIATATVDDPPEIDPTEAVFETPLRHRAPADVVLPWLGRARNAAYRDAMTKLVLAAAFERGRVAAWRDDFEALRRRIVTATARGELVTSQDRSSETPDEPMLAFADTWAARDDHGLRLALALQRRLGFVEAMADSDRDYARSFVFQDLAAALTRLPH